MPPKYFPLRWESTGDQWWFASPIDCAAANGHSDLVRELIQIDNNLIFKLTSLDRIRRLETVWDDDGGDRGSNAVAKCRSRVARNLLRDCETLTGHNSLIRAGYGGWVLYTAASAGDLVFVRELLERDPLLVFGEGEYGVTDILYAAARSRSCEVFRAVLDCCLTAVKGRREEVPLDFRWEMMNRAVHAAARGGSLGILKELFGDGSDVLAYRDNQGSTVLHTAAGRGQIEIVKILISQYDIITSVDNRGNTALHVAAYRGHLPVVEALISASPPSASSTNNHGDTFLHMAVAGFRSPSIIRLDQQIDLLRKLIAGNFVKIEHIINSQNNDGRTPLHTAIIEDIPSDIIELIIYARYIDFNIRDSDGNTPLDLLNQRPKSTSSKILIKRLVSAGGFFSNGGDQIQIKKSRNALVSHLRLHGIGSPGISFRIPDADIISQVGIEDNRRSSSDFTDYGNYSGEIGLAGSTPSIPNSSKFKKMSSMDRANVRFKSFLRWLGKKDKSVYKSNFEEDTLSFKSYSMCSNSSLQNSPVPLRQQFSKLSNLPSNRRILSLQGNIPSPSTKNKYVAHDARQVLPKSNLGSPCSAFSESSWPTPNLGSGSVGPSSSSQYPDLKKFKMKRKHGSFNLRSVNNYFCMGTHGLQVEKLMKSQPGSENQQSLVV